jgi:ParB family transcriptional regulator, chromosome partitioning protein
LATLVQRLRRNELSPIAEASLFVNLISEQTARIADIALATGRTEEQIARSLRLLGLPEKERDMIDRGALSRAAAFQLLDASVLDPANPVVSPGTRTP